MSTCTAWPRITIVTPTFNRVEYLEDCIQSVLQQNYPNLEYIICDGGSKNEELFALIRKYVGRLAWWDSQPDRGHAEAIRRGIDRSTGQLMTWLCSDDILLPGALHAIGSEFIKHPDSDVLYGHSRIVDATGRTMKSIRAIPYLELAAFTTAGIHQPASFWTREVYERVGGKVGGANWENVVYEPNVELFCRFQKANARFRRVKAEITANRIHEGTVNTQQTEKVRAMSRQTFRKFYPICGIPWVYRCIHFVMRFYQVGALFAQGDGAFIVDRFRKKTDRSG